MDAIIQSSDNELRAFALQAWANTIETGNPALSARDAVQSKRPNLIKALADDQVALVLRIRALAAEDLASDVAQAGAQRPHVRQR